MKILSEDEREMIADALHYMATQARHAAVEALESVPGAFMSHQAFASKANELANDLNNQAANYDKLAFEIEHGELQLAPRTRS